MPEQPTKSITRRSVLQILGRSVIVSSIVILLISAQNYLSAAGVEPVKNRDNIFAYRSFWPEFKAMGQFRDAGVNTVCIFAANTDNSLGQPYCKYPPVWRWFGKYDFGSLEEQFDDVLAVNPEAEFICMVDLNTPIWLQRQLTLRGQSADCESFTMLSCACANESWLKATTEYLEAVVKHMEKRYGDRIRAYLLACGQTDEWMDTSRGAAGRTKTEKWKKWLEGHGKKDVPVPTFERMDRASFNDLIRDPKTEQDIIDYNQFNSDLIVDTILSFAKKTRGLIPKKRQIGVFFGYILELARYRLVSAGHLEYERLYASGDIDFFISPGTYTDRLMGGGSGFMVPNGTRVLNGKGFLHEVDHRTPTYNLHLDEYVSIGWVSPWKNQQETNAGLKREFSLAIINNASTWCFDMWGGVFQSQETMKLVAQSKKLWDRYTVEKYKSRSEVALIVDPQSTQYINDQNPIVGQIYQKMRNKLNRLGAPFEVFSFNDLEKADLGQYKMLVMPGLFLVTPERMDILKNHVFKDGRTVLFVYAPGICDGKDLNTARVEKLTGTEFDTEGINKMQRDGWVSVYIADYEMITPKVLKQLAAEAKVTIYCEDEAPVYANERLVAIHTAAGGKKNITLPIPAHEVKELYSQKVILVENQQFSYNFSSPDTALFEIVTK